MGHLKWGEIIWTYLPQNLLDICWPSLYKTRVIISIMIYDKSYSPSAWPPSWCDSFTCTLWCGGIFKLSHTRGKHLNNHLGRLRFILFLFLFIFFNSLSSWIFRGKIFMAANEYSAPSLLRKSGERREWGRQLGASLKAAAAEENKPQRAPLLKG